MAAVLGIFVIGPNTTEAVRHSNQLADFKTAFSRVAAIEVKGSGL